MNGGCRGEASDQGLCKINGHKAEPKKAKGQLLQKKTERREFGFENIRWSAAAATIHHTSTRSMLIWWIEKECKAASTAFHAGWVELFETDLN